MNRLLLALAPVATLVVDPAMAQSPPDPTWMWNYGWGMGGMMFGGGLLMLFFWGALVLLVVLLVRWIGGFGPQQMVDRSRQTPLEILQERFARGEIDKQEFDDRRRTLASR